MSSMQAIVHDLDQALQERRDGDLDIRAFYRCLLELNARLVQVLQEELADQTTIMSDADVRKQIPLMLVMLEEQIALFQARH